MDMLFDMTQEQFKEKLLRVIANVNSVLKRRIMTNAEAVGEVYTSMRREFSWYNFHEYIRPGVLCVETDGERIRKISYNYNRGAWMPPEKRDLFNRLRMSLNYEIKGTTLAELEIESIVNSI